MPRTPGSTRPRASAIRPVRMGDDALLLLDQRALPRHERTVRCRTVGDVVRGIRNMTVRGAPAIGVAAAYGHALGARLAATISPAAFAARMERHAAALRAARPTAVNLAWAVDRMERVRRSTSGAPSAVARALMAEARRIDAEDVQANMTMGKHGQALLPDAGTVLTHCNAGALATAGYGTALGVIRAAREAGKDIAVIADETRPFLQGARLTAWELAKDGIPVTLVADVAAGHLMSRGKIQAVIVGADRIAMNGDVANKIGTYQVACLARRHGIPFYVAAPVSTIDPARPDGSTIPIEERDPREVVEMHGRRVAPDRVTALNPAFDVTPAELVSAIITEQGIARPPYGTSLARLDFGGSVAPPAPEDAPARRVRRGR